MAGDGSHKKERQITIGRHRRTKGEDLKTTTEEGRKDIYSLMEDSVLSHAGLRVKWKSVGRRESKAIFKGTTGDEEVIARGHPYSRTKTTIV